MGYGKCHLHHCFSHGTPSLFPLMNNFLEKGVALNKKAQQVNLLGFNHSKLTKL